MRRPSSPTPLLAALAAAAVLSFRPIYEPDIWWHLAHGREDAAGRIVRTNVFSFTYPDYRQRFTTWLFDVAAYAGWSAMGPAGVQVLQGGFLALAFWLMFLACRARAPAWSAAAVLALGFFILEPRAIPRPHLASFAGMAACSWLVERARQRRSAAPMAWTIPLVALWSNLHVECVFGVALLALFAASELLLPQSLTRPQAARAAAFAAAAAVATMANPYGWGLVAYLYENLSVPGILSIAELRPPYWPDYRAFFVYAGLGVVLMAIGPRRPAAWEVAALLVFGAMGAMHLRLTPLLLFALAPVVAERIAWLEARGIDRRALLITSACAALAVSRIPVRLLATELAVGRRAVEPPQFFSPAAVAFIERSPLEGRVFNSHNLGGYLAWTLHPRVRIFQDSRLQAYPPELFREIVAASGSQEAWDALVRDVDWAILSVPRPNQLSGAGRFPSREWRTVFEDQAIEVLVRRTGRYGELRKE